MEYTFEDYKKDLVDPEIPHIKSREHFKAFYDQLGTDDVQKSQGPVGQQISLVKPKGLILELGCHWGFNCLYYAKQGFKCTGVDVSTTLIAHGLKMLLKESKVVNSNVVLINSFIEDFIPPHLYDTIILTETLERVIDPLIILKKAKECLKEDGIIYISAPASMIGSNSHVRGINGDEMTKLINDAGLSVVSMNSTIDETLAIAKNI